MISLKTIDINNYRMVSSLKVAEEQKEYVAPAVSILARTYAMRDQNARAFAIYNDELIVGVLMVRDIYEEPACYDLDQFLIDYRYQHKGYGGQALKLIIEMLSKEHTFNCIELCVKMKDSVAIKMYKNAGFIDTNYIDPDEPDAYILRYEL